MVTIPDAVDEMVNAAWGLYGGKGRTGSRVLRPEKGHRGNKMQIYIAGKITGLDHEEAASMFTYAEAMIESKGHVPLNPLAMVDQAEGRSYMAYLLDALRIVEERAEAIYFLGNWHDSWGAIKEFEFAKHENIPVYFTADEIPEVQK